MINRILIAVDDSPAAFAAARTAVQIAANCRAIVRVVTVVADDGVGDQLRAELGSHGTARRPDGLAARRDAAAGAVLRHVADLAGRAGVPVDTRCLRGRPAALILDLADGWRADLVVIGRSDLPGAGRPYIGAQTRQVLEFAPVPVLVVPAPRPDA